MRRIKLFLLLTLSLFVFSCDIGLGEAVDVMAPEVKLSSPTVSQSVTPLFVINGEASDNYGVASITVDIEGDEYSDKFKWDGNTWYIMNDSGWVEYPSASISGNPKNLQFSIPVNASKAVSGHEYSITTKVSDAYGNEGAKTKDERNVIIDTSEPVVSIIEPMGLQDPDDPEFNTYVLKNNSVLPKIKNGTFVISGSQREDTNLDYLVVYLDTEKTAIASKSVTEYPVASPLVRKEIHGDNLRNWSTTITPEDFTDKSVLEFDPSKDPESQAHIFRLVTESHDQAGNVEIKSQRWFKFNNGADIPWVNADFGFPNTSEGIAESKIAQNRYFPHCSIQGQAYDDDGIKSIKIKIYDSEKGTEIGDYSLSEEKLAAEGNPTYKAWDFNVIAETKTIVVKIDIEDINGIKGEQFVRVLTVSDVNPPNILEIYPANGDSALGDASGSIFFNGKIDDDGEVKCLKIVRIKSGNEADQMKYLDEDYSEWAKCTETNKKHTDDNGNKIFWVTLGGGQKNSVTGRYEYTFGNTFNIFNDFEINSTERLTNQKFVIFVQDKGNSTNVESYTLQGDINPPELSIEGIYLNEVVNDKNHYFALDPNKPVELPKPFVRNGNLEITDKIKIVGKWKDNSSELWTNTGKTKNTYVSLKFAIDNYKNNIDVEVKSDGTWETGFISPVDSSVSVLNATITDWGGNPTTTSRSYYVNSSEPVLTRIGANTPDGSYSSGQKIEITMEFNKAVEFKGGTANPYLVLNAKKGTAIAYYDGKSNKSSKHVFVYTVGKDDEDLANGTQIKKLNVERIVKNGHKWIDATATDSAKAAEIESLSVPSSGGASLEGTRAIVIDTKAPSLKEINLISGSGWNKAGKAIFVEAKFSEEVNIDKDDLNDFKMKFSNDKLSQAATRTGPDTLLFKYIIGENDGRWTNLRISEIKNGGHPVTDNAGNSLETIELGTKNIPANTVNVDTQSPTAPVIQNLPAKRIVYGDSFTFEIPTWDGDINTSQNLGSKKYTLDGSAWMDYTGPVTVNKNGNYSISAKQTDAAGNESPASTPVEVTLNKNKIISSITSQQSDGVYTTGKDIIIEVNCNEKMIVDLMKDGSGNYKTKLSLNTTPVKYAYYLSGSGTEKLTFKYTIAEGDKCTVAAGLNVNSFISDIKTDENGIDFSNRCEIPSSNNLNNNRTINIITGKPVIDSISVNQDGTSPVLKIKFDRNISKNVGDDAYITIKQAYEKNNQTVYNAPAVLTKDQYNSFKKGNSDVDLYYEKGINGASSSYVVDLSEKYVLKFNYDGTTKEVREYFRDTVLETITDGSGNVADSRGILTVWIPVASSKVTVDPTDSMALIVTLTGSYKLPVKGAEYTVTVPENIVIDEQEHKNPDESTQAGKYVFTLDGVEKPVIRVNKSECTISNSVAIQPLRAQVKMDCQTPGKSISYAISTVETETKNVDNDSVSNNTVVTPNTAKAAVKSDGTYSTTTALYIGDANNTSSGYKITINANVTGTDEYAYEIAYRSVVRLQQGASPSTGGDNGGFSTPNDLHKVYIRGGDSESGNSSTVAFPLSWNSGDYSKVKLMTHDGTNWYYVSWNISVNLYYGFLLGNFGASDADTMANGPYNWCWASCSWVGRKHLYYLRPGTSFTMIPGGNSLNTGSYNYQPKHLEYRSQATQKSGYGVLVNSIN